jgi:aminopeptidase N
MRFLIFFFFMCACFVVLSQHENKQQHNIDILNYNLTLTIQDKNNSIDGVEHILIRYKKEIDSFSLDLKGPLKKGANGMTVISIKKGTIPVRFKQGVNRTVIYPTACDQEIDTFTIHYKGIPDDGLIIGKNKFNERTFFGDNWPTRASNWFACIDHPSDKATVDYTLIAPSHYQIVANGTKESAIIKGKTQTTHFKMNTPIPTKVMVFGAANFIKETSQLGSIRITNYVYPSEEKKGLSDFMHTAQILSFLQNYIGDYPFTELHNVQSTTTYGGMENAGCIFYDENAITGTQQIDELITHELAHQWFGNSATEADWTHLWLSEGFATFMTNLYILNSLGNTAFKKQLISDRNRVIQFYKQQQLPLHDTISNSAKEMLNTNAYQKGAWVLQMLRNELGEELFKLVIRTYYNTYKFKNATTNDFFSIACEESQKDLHQFQHQWTSQKGHPKLKISFTSSKNEHVISINQLQENHFEFPLEIEILYENGSIELKQLAITKKQEVLTLPFLFPIRTIKLDPNVKLLFEEIK